MRPTRSTERMRVFDVAIIGAGPVGLEAAAGARARGLDTVVLEAGTVGEHLARWGWVRLFSDFGLNAGPAGARLLSETGAPLPRDDEMMTGAQLRERYLVPLASALTRDVRLQEGARVIEVSRARRLKGEALGSPSRSDEPFRLLVTTAGREREEFARSVLDCSGTYGRPNWAGPGGAPARGERALRKSIDYHLPDPLGTHRYRFAGARTLLLGSGHSAATTALALADLATGAAGTRFTWAVRRPAGPPLPMIADDPLPERAALAVRAASLASSPPPGSEWMPDARLAAIAARGDGFEVQLEVRDRSLVERFDRVVANVGYEPDDSLYRQLQIHECYASRGPMKLAAALLAAAGDGPADCLAGGSLGPETLVNPEPGFFILGMKSYGKNSAFLMRTGYEQVVDALSLIESRSPADHIRL